MPSYNPQRDEGIDAMRRGDIGTALPLLESACVSNPDDFYAHLVLGGAYYSLKQDAKAVEMLNCAIVLNPESAQAHYNLGIALERMEKLEEAVASVERAVKLHPTYPQAASVLRKWKRRLASLPEEETALVSSRVNNRPKTRRRAATQGVTDKKEEVSYYTFEPVECPEANQALIIAVLSLIPTFTGIVLGPIAIGRAIAARRWIKGSPYLKGENRAVASIFIGLVGSVISTMEFIIYAVPTLLRAR